MAKFSSDRPFNFTIQALSFVGEAGVQYTCPDDFVPALCDAFERTDATVTISSYDRDGGGGTHPDLASHESMGLADAAHAHAGYATTGHTHSYAATTHSHAEADVTSLASDLAGKAASIHTHAESAITNLVTDLAGKAAAVHTHAYSSITGAPQGGSSFQFPVGAIYITTDSTDPATVLGYGTWSAFGAGRFLLGATDTAEATGGADTHTHADHPAQSHSGAAVADHSAGTTGANSGSAVKVGTSGASAAPNAHTHSTPALTHSVTQPSTHAAASHDSVSNLPPYMTAFMFKRTA